MLLFYAQRQKNVPFRYLFGLFGLFILSCGFTHFMDWYTFHTPMYRLSGVVKLITALASWATVVALIPVTPRALAMRSPEELERLVDERTEELNARSEQLRLINEQLRREVQERIRVEELLRERQTEIESLNTSLETRVRERTAELQSANVELESFCYSVSHDLRQPLRAIDGYSFTLAEDAGPRLKPDDRENIERVRAAAKRMDHLITALLKLSRVHRSEMKVGPVDLSQIAESVLTELRQADPTRQVETRVEPNLEAQGDAEMLRVLLVNLISNAWKFTSKTENPRIEIGRQGDEYFVRDNGAGFEAQYAHKLFLPFERLHHVSEFEGSGVGLATVERIVRRHGGTVRAEGEVGQGATLYFRIP